MLKNSVPYILERLTSITRLCILAQHELSIATSALTRTNLFLHMADGVADWHMSQTIRKDSIIEFGLQAKHVTN